MSLTLTPAQHRVMTDVSDGDWHTLVPHHSRSVVARVYALGMIRCDDDSAIYEDRLWTVTPRGEEYIKGVANG